MLHFSDTDAGRAWIATGDSRETSERVMRAIAWTSRDAFEADYVWETGLNLSGINILIDICEMATSEGHDPDTLHWGGRTLTRIMAGE